MAKVAKTMHFGKKLNEDEQKLRTLNSLAQVFGRTVRILTGKQIKTAVVNLNSMPYPAWTDIPTRGQLNCIYYNLSCIGDVKTTEDIVRITGVNHHEAAHVWFTPSIKILGSDPNPNPIEKVLRSFGSRGTTSFNILEDQRIESMMVGVYPAIRHYYSAMIAGYILNGSEANLKTAWLLVHGRKYLGSKLRNGLRDIFVSPELADDLAQIIDDYRLLNLYLSKHQVLAARLIERFTKLLYEAMPQQPDYQHTNNYSFAQPTSDDKSNAENASTKVRAGKDDRDIMKKEDDAKDTDGSGNSDDSSDSKKGEEESERDEYDNGNRDDNGGNEADADSDGEDQDCEGEGDDNGSESNSSDSSSQDSGGGSAGSGTGSIDRSEIEQIAEAFAELLGEAMQDEQIMAEIKRTQETIKNSAHKDTVGQHRGWITDSRPEVVATAKRFARRLEKIRTDFDPGWERNQPQGRLNVQRAMHGDPLGDVWDTWTEGKTDATDIEMVLAVDVSGSMSGSDHELSGATWVIKHAADKLDIPCTVYAYDQEGYLIYGAQDRAKVNMFPNTGAMGGTSPNRVIVESMRVLSASKRKKKLFIVMTDGAWTELHLSSHSYNVNCDQAIAEMNGAGILTAMVYLSRSWMRKDAINWHNCQVQRQMYDLTGFPEFADELVRKLMKK